MRLKICYFKIIQHSLKSVLGKLTGANKIPTLEAPFFKPVIVGQLYACVNYEGNNAIAQAFLEHDKPSYTSVAGLKGMDFFESCMKFYYIFKCFCPAVFGMSSLLYAKFRINYFELAN